MQDAAHSADPYDVATIMGSLYGDGIIACKGAFERAWVARLGQDIDTLFEEARRQPGGALERGPSRYYVEVHPERISGFVVSPSGKNARASCSVSRTPST